MYTHIPTQEALEEIHAVLDHLIEALELIMNNNIFQFSDTFWKQLSGTAMGTPPACMWATLFFDRHEQDLCTTYADWLIDWARYIDDGIGIWNWTGTPECIPAFADFKTSLQQFHLSWEINQPSNTVNYLDITLTINNGQISSDLFEKKLHLYLYLPSASAHPPGVLKGLVAGSILRIVRLTSNPLTRKRHLQNFYRRLLARGYNPSHILPIFNKYLRQYYRDTTTATVAPPPATATPNGTHENTIFMHLPFHPLNPPSIKVQQLFRKHLLKENLCNPYASVPLYKLSNGRGKQLGINRMIVAYHRPKNIGNLVTPRHIDRLPGPSALALL